MAATSHWQSWGVASPLPASSNPEDRVASLPRDLVLVSFSFVHPLILLEAASLTCRRWNKLSRDLSLWRHLGFVDAPGHVERVNFANLGLKAKGTEGSCFCLRQRSSGKLFAMKRARVYPKGEGVPYYMLRELSVMQGMQHPRVSTPLKVSLAGDELHVFFESSSRS